MKAKKILHGNMAAFILHPSIPFCAKSSSWSNKEPKKFFGELSFDVQDLLRKDSDGLGTISVIRLNDIQDKPKLFSTFVLSLLAEIYETFPEIGDQDRPKLVLFIDEAHLFFKEASQALRDQIESIIKLIRSKRSRDFLLHPKPR